ncbi:MAG: AraC family transcriptional regulator [Muricauda sp.]|nr:AraC family transcriptional regulator [Allomuricauda sp.]MBC72511.1 AraC family transcriptional regulator [Allomuricauda sp.]|tara:strand:+ start:2301 stop:3134 length:834 start_codon:yes stop_codon:yes gene_type:complete
MKKRNLYLPYEIENRVMTEYVAKEFQNTYFEMIFVLEGNGVQVINSNRLAYGPNKLFLVFPRDVHSFEIKETSHFFFLRFNESYLKEQPSHWLNTLEYIFHNHDHLPGCVLKHLSDKTIVRSLTEAITMESEGDAPYHREVVQQLINTLITIAARNISIRDNAPKFTPSYPISLQGYIHRHIYEPEKLRSQTMASVFHVSPHYLGERFKKETGENLKDYIGKYRIKLMESRLQYTDMRINELSAEFGMTDSSHLTKFFLRHTGMTPTQFRARSRKQA